METYDEHPSSAGPAVTFIGFMVFLAVVPVSYVLAVRMGWLPPPYVSPAKAELIWFATECPSIRSYEHLPQLLKEKERRPLTDAERTVLVKFRRACNDLAGLR